MKKIFSFSATIVLFTILFATGISNTDVVQAEPAVIINDNFCRFSLGEAGVVDVYDAKVVITKSKNGNEIRKCSADGIDNPTGKAIRLSGASTGAVCYTPGGTTDKWHTTVSAGGHATIVCLYKN